MCLLVIPEDRSQRTEARIVCRLRRGILRTASGSFTCLLVRTSTNFLRSIFLTATRYDEPETPDGRSHGVSVLWLLSSDFCDNDPSKLNNNVSEDRGRMTEDSRVSRLRRIETTVGLLQSFL